MKSLYALLYGWFINATGLFMILFSLAAVIMGGGYALGLFGWMKPSHSLWLFFLEGGWAFSILLKGYEQGSNSDFFMTLIHAIIIALVAILTVVICGLHLFWPKTAAGAGALITMAIYAFIYYCYFDEKRRLATKPV